MAVGEAGWDSHNICILEEGTVEREVPQCAHLGKLNWGLHRSGKYRSPSAKSPMLKGRRRGVERDTGGCELSSSRSTRILKGF